jgi:hypothetical protein
MVGFCVLLGAVPPTAHAQRGLPPLSPAPRDSLTRALDSGRLSEAAYALARARTLFELRAVRDEFDRVAAPSPHAATAILRDLFLRRFALHGAEARAATRILARPSSSQSACDTTRPLCFHWGSQVTANDVAATRATFAAVYDLEVESYGYLAPLPDGTRGGNSKTDIYLRDLGAQKIFGYCTNDGPSSFPDVPAYCVVDEDFAEFGKSQTPQEFRDVTAAHEFFHAIQFAYDSEEDLWLMEGTAMLMEGQFRPGVDDRIRYLRNSALMSPETPVDRGQDGFQYGAWIYWRFLVEELGELADPLVVRRVWERAAGARTDTDGPGPDRRASNPYSLQAARRVLEARGESFRSLFAKFTRVNRAPASFYDEGADYPIAPAAGQHTMGAGQRIGWQSVALRHLASASYVFRPKAGTGDARLHVAVDLPKPRYGAEARLLVRLSGGERRTRAITLDSTGHGSRSVDFGPGVTRADLILTNASTRMSCGKGTSYSCAGTGVDDLRPYAYRVSVR